MPVLLRNFLQILLGRSVPIEAIAGWMRTPTPKKVRARPPTRAELRALGDFYDSLEWEE